jgi:hypothetical protein
MRFLSLWGNELHGRRLGRGQHSMGDVGISADAVSGSTPGAGLAVDGGLTEPQRLPPWHLPPYRIRPVPAAPRAHPRPLPRNCLKGRSCPLQRTRTLPQRPLTAAHLALLSAAIPPSHHITSTSTLSCSHAWFEATRERANTAQENRKKASGPVGGVSVYIHVSVYRWFWGCRCWAGFFGSRIEREWGFLFCAAKNKKERTPRKRAGRDGWQ